MIQALNTKIVPVILPAAIVDNASPTSVVIDTAGYDFCQVFVLFGAMDIAVTTMKIQEAEATSDANTLSSGADVTGLVYGTSTDISGATSALPSATADNTVYCFDIDLRARKRYLDLALTCGDGAAGTFVTAWAVLSRPEQMPVTAAQRGLANVLAA